MRSDHSDHAHSHNYSEEHASFVSREKEHFSSHEHTFFKKSDVKTSDHAKSYEKRMELAGSDMFSSEEFQGKMWVDSSKRRTGTEYNMNSKVKRGGGNAVLNDEEPVRRNGNRHPSCCTIS